MNPDTLNYSVNSLDDAMLDRFVAIEVTANLDDYIDYSIMNRPNDDVLDFLQACPEMLLAVRKSNDAMALSKAPTPRGWTKVQELMNNCNLEEKLMYEIIAGLIGPETTASFFGFIKNRDFKIPSTDSILNNFHEVKPLILEIIHKNRLDIINLMIKKVVTTFTLSEVHINNVNCFVETLPEELKILFFKYLAAKRESDFEKLSEEFKDFDRLEYKILEIMMT